MSLGTGCVYSTSHKQKLSTRSSTESEVVGVYDVLVLMLWTNNFLRAQGYVVDDTVLYQDNKSAILLEENGKSSSSKRTRHMKIRYFFIKDQVDSKEIRVEYCPTKEMLGDFFTKPTQGRLFQWQRDHIMGLDDCSEYYSGVDINATCEVDTNRSYVNENSSSVDPRSVLVADKSTPRSYSEVVTGKR